MNKRSHGLIGAILLIILTGGGLIGCADDQLACIYDSECGGSALCIEQLCAETCTSDNDCVQALDTCEAHLREGENSPVNICLPAHRFGRNSGYHPQCQTDQQCRALLATADAICGLSNTCVLPVDEPNNGNNDNASSENNDSSNHESNHSSNNHIDSPSVPHEPDECSPERPGSLSHAVLIRDITSVDPQQSPDAQIDEGVRLDAVFILGDDEKIMGFGTAIVYSPASSVVTRSHLDGRDPGVNEVRQCRVVANHEESPQITPLGGHDGHVLVAFFGRDGLPLQLLAGWSVVVMAGATICSDYDDNDGTPEVGSDNDIEYNVQLCVKPADASRLNLEHCNMELGQSSEKYAQFEIPELLMGGE